MHEPLESVRVVEKPLAEVDFGEVAVHDAEGVPDECAGCGRADFRRGPAVKDDRLGAVPRWVGADYLRNKFKD